MKILLLGATGRTGKFIIEEAIKRGHRISAIARNPEKLKGFDIDITLGTPYNCETVEKAITGCEAIINTLNVSRKSDNPWAPLAAPKDMISKSASNAIKAMEKVGKEICYIEHHWCGAFLENNTCNLKINSIR
jgi:putative NADH-flavin reductase